MTKTWEIKYDVTPTPDNREVRLELWREIRGAVQDRAAFYLTRNQAGDLADSLNFAFQESDPDLMHDLETSNDAEREYMEGA